MDKYIAFDCGPAGNIVAAKGISFRPVKLPIEIGALVVAEATLGEIQVKIDLDNHLTTLTLVKKNKPDPKLAKLAIRAPIGVRIFQISPAQDGFDQELFHETGPGYNTLPKYIAPGEDVLHGQTVQEVVLITGHVPPRRDPALLGAGDFGGFKKLTRDQLATRLSQSD